MVTNLPTDAFVTVFEPNSPAKYFALFDDAPHVREISFLNWASGIEKESYVLSEDKFYYYTVSTILLGIQFRAHDPIFETMILCPEHKEYGYKRRCITHADALEMHADACTFLIEKLCIAIQYVIYEKPSDFPDNFVLRKTLIRDGIIQPDRKALLFSDLESTRAALPVGLLCLPRFANDEPQIVEVWI